jgi:hypothetical protein
MRDEGLVTKEVESAEMNDRLAGMRGDFFCGNGNALKLSVYKRL